MQRRQFFPALLVGVASIAAMVKGTRAKLPSDLTLMSWGPAGEAQPDHFMWGHHGVVTYGATDGKESCSSGHTILARGPGESVWDDELPPARQRFRDATVFRERCEVSGLGAPHDGEYRRSGRHWMRLHDGFVVPRRCHTYRLLGAGTPTDPFVVELL